MHSKKVYLLCESSKNLGFGHVVRCMSIAHELLKFDHIKPIFAYKGEQNGRNFISDHKITCIDVDDYNSFSPDNNSSVLLDLRFNLDPIFFEKAHSKGCEIYSLDDPTLNRLKAKKVFYPPVPQVNMLDWAGFNGEIFKGFKYIPLRKEFSNKCFKYAKEIDLLITMGGTDPQDLASKVLLALKNISKPLKITLIAGFKKDGDENYYSIIRSSNHELNILRNVDNMSEEMNKAKAAICTFGMTSYELAACKIPQAIIALTKDHEMSASALIDANVACYLGLASKVSPASLSSKLKNFILKPQATELMRAKLLTFHIKNGSKNIAQEII